MALAEMLRGLSIGPVLVLSPLCIALLAAPACKSAHEGGTQPNLGDGGGDGSVGEGEPDGTFADSGGLDGPVDQGCEPSSPMPIVPAVEVGPADLDFSLEHGGLDREYRVIAPSSYTIDEPIPVVLAFHGGGGDIDSFSMTLLDETAEAAGFLLVYPQGTGPTILPGTALEATIGTWNAGGCCGETDVDDVGFTAALIDDLATRFRVDETRVYATGISNGGMMSYRLGCELADRIAAIAPVAPPIVTDEPQQVLSECAPSHPVALIHFHGELDSCALIGKGSCGGCFAEAWNACSAFPIEEEAMSCDPVPEQIDRWRGYNGCDEASQVSFEQGAASCVTHGSCSSNVEVTLCVDAELGHQWPGGAANTCLDPESCLCKQRQAVLGPQSDSLPANDLMWGVFSRYQRCP